MATARQTASGRDLLRMKPGPHPVVTCYLKIETRDRARKKYLTKVKNRVKAIESTLGASHWTKAQQEMARLDLARILDYLGDEANLPSSPGIALFASAGHKLFEVHELPKVHRSRLAIERTVVQGAVTLGLQPYSRVGTVRGPTLGVGHGELGQGDDVQEGRLDEGRPTFGQREYHVVKCS